MPTGKPQKLSFQAIVTHNVKEFPGMMVDDLYKFVFQAAMGSEHAVIDPARVQRYLVAEINDLRPGPVGPLMMPISPDHRLVRVYLGPYLAAGGDLVRLARAFVLTSQTFRPSMDRLSRYWSWTEAMAAQDDLPFSLDTLQRYGDRRRAQGFPPVHHSAQYRRRYRPAYRVVLKDLIANDALRMK